jgi:hypothetical protein
MADIFEPIVIRAKQLKAFLGEAVLTKPLVKAVTTTSNTAMLSAIIVHVVYREKCWMRFAAHCTYTTIGSKNLVTKLIYKPFMSSAKSIGITIPITLEIFTALLTKTLIRSRSKTFGTKTLFFSTSISRSTHIALARLAVELQTILSTALFPKTISSKPLLASGTKLLLLRRYQIDLNNSLVIGLIAQPIKIERVLKGDLVIPHLHDSLIVNVLTV